MCHVGQLCEMQKALVNFWCIFTCPEIVALAVVALNNSSVEEKLQCMLHVDEAFLDRSVWLYGSDLTIITCFAFFFLALFAFFSTTWQGSMAWHH